VTNIKRTGLSIHHPRLPFFQPLIGVHVFPGLYPDFYWRAGVLIDRSKFLSLCHSVAEAAHDDLSSADREMLLVLHRALSELKVAVEKALLSGSSEGRLAS
jgi:hypothetical protein